MGLQDLLETLLVWGIYPLWLLAGAGDYLCHRHTDIEHSSGSAESWFHVLQFLTLLITVAAAILWEPGVLPFSVMVLAVLAHSVLAHLDVSYTDGRRYISPIEQLIHGFMHVLPLVAVAIFGVLHWQQISAGLAGGSWTFVPLDAGRVGLLASFSLLAGLPILEELVRTLRHRGERQQQRYQAGLATIK